MTLSHEQARDLLEAYALRALPPEERDAVERHVADCAECRDEASALQRVADALPETLGERAPSPALRERVLSAARAEAAPRARPRLPRLRPAWFLGAFLVLVSAASLAFAVQTQQRLVAVQAQLERDNTIRTALAQSRASWYMSGADAYRGSGGWLVEAKPGDVSFVLFHDLRPLPGGSRYAIWLIAPTGKWVRAVNFSPTGERLQRVDVPETVDEYVQCAVTVEATDSGPRSGPIAMQGRIAQ